MRTYVCLDTNIIIRFITQGKPGCELEHWDRLTQLISDGSVTLLVPEIVMLEVGKLWRRMPEEIEAKLRVARQDLEKWLDSQIKYSELQDLPTAILKTFDELRNTKKPSMQSRHSKANATLTLQSVQQIPLTPEIFLRAKKRSIAHLLAKPKNDSDQDCCLIESLIVVFENADLAAVQLLFCSENTSDFGLELSDGKWTLHPNVNAGLPATEYFRDLASLVEFAKQDIRIIPPAPDTVKEAVEREEEEAIEERTDAFSDSGGNLLAAIIGIRSLIQSHLGIDRSGKVSRRFADRIYEVVIEFEEAKLAFISDPIVTKMWNTLHRILRANEILLTGRNGRDSINEIDAKKEVDALSRACEEFISLSAKWIDIYREAH